MLQRPRKLFPQLINREQMRTLTASLLYDGIRDHLVGQQEVRISIRGVRVIGPGQYSQATTSEIVPDRKETLDNFAVPEFDLYMIEGTFQPPKHDPAQLMTRAEFMVDLLDRVDSFAEALKYSPNLYEQVRAEADVAGHYIKGAFDITELADLSYLESEEPVANLDI